jgi:Tfp pilus assembly protein PilX
MTWLRRRMRGEDGFALLVVLGILTIAAGFTAAVLLSATGDARLTRADLDGKRAYLAAQAGLQSYLNSLNTTSNAASPWWQTCSNDTQAKMAVPGSTTGTFYSYAPVPANGYTACSTSDPVSSLIDSSTSTLRIESTGYSGPNCATSPSACQTRTLVASVRPLSPLDFLWYTVHETMDTAITGTNSGCNTFYWQGSGPPSSCYIYWVTGDQIAGPAYTQDQFLINPGGAPVFGSGPADKIESEAPGTSQKDVCAFSNCQNANFTGTAVWNVTPKVPLPSDNSNLVQDATAHGAVYAGTTNVQINTDGTDATVVNCPTTSTSCKTPVTLNLITHPIIYASGACPASNYDPTNVNYTTNSSGYYYGSCGDVYVQGTYKTPLTIAAADDIIVTGNLQTTEDSSGNPTGTATLGLVANNYVRVKHDNSGNPDRTIDAAILTLQHSFFVDNYNAGGNHLGQLTVNGAIAQFYRGAVGQVNANGYLKNYSYDDRLAVTLPPYLFDLQNTQWGMFRQTLCKPSASTTDPASCAYTGT